MDRPAAPRPRRDPSTRVRRVTVPAVAMLVGVAVLMQGTPALADPGDHFVKPEVPVVAPVAVTPVGGGSTTVAAPPSSTAPAPAWPVGEAVVELSSLAPAMPGPQEFDGRPVAQRRVRAGDLPVQVSKSDRRSGHLKVEVLDRAATERANVKGLLVRLSATEGSRAPGRVDVSVGYEAFATAYGGDWSSRLRLVQLPECALSTPDSPACAPVPLASSRNDTATATVSGTVTRSGAAMLVALTAGSSGEAGDFGASSLSSSSTWSAGGMTGDFTWNYPMRVPPAQGGPSPSLALNYSAQSVDGRNAATNNQPSWLGEGFELAAGGFIERRYKVCGQDMGAGANNTVKTGDLCWETDNAVLSLAGHSGELLYNSTEGRWHLRNDDGTRVQRLTGATNGDNDGEYWVITTTDGTQYWLGANRLPGWASGNPTTNSTLTVPVFGNESGEPCHAATFAASSCAQAWRWNLDYIVDLNDNSASFWYTKQTNKYARNNSTSDAAVYDRAGYLDHISYGTRRVNNVDSVLGSPVPQKVVFGAADRCLSNCGTHNATTWPDTPWDTECTAAPCTVASPTFWSTKRLSTLTTQVWDGFTFRDVERWTFTHTFPDPGDGTRAGLWLASIAHAGLVGMTTTVPDIVFTGVQLANRVDTTGDFAAAMNWWRIASIRNETGGTLSVVYSAPDCVAGQPMPALESNTRRCYPVKWIPDGYTNPVTDWYHKYVVTTLYEDPQTVTGGTPPAGSPRVVYAYSYLDGAAWHYTDDNGLIDPAYKTWSVWRGYARVGVTIGDPGEQTYTETRFLRGMHGDKLPSGTRTVTVPGTGVPDVNDEDGFAGMVREKTVYNGPGGAVVSREVNEPWQSAQTASRTINGTTVYARFIAVTASHQRVARDLGRPDRVSTTTSTFDSYGMVTQVDDLGDEAVTGDEKCTKTTYEPRNTTAWLVDTPNRFETYAVACANATNPSSLAEADVIGEDRVSYDGQAWQSAPTKGLVTKRQEMSAWNAGAPTFVTTAQNTHDSHGRITQTTNAINAITTFAFTPATGGPVTQVVTTNALGHASTQLLEPAWGLPTASIDPNTKRTDVTYDGLGRTTAVWKPGRDKATQSANVTYSYTIRTDGASAIGTSTLNAAGAYNTSYELYDGLQRARQTQAPSPTGGRILTETFYDTAGRGVRTYGAYAATGAPSTDLVTATQAVNVPSQTVTQYDGAGRVTATIFKPYDVVRWTTTTAYGGDRVDVTPPAGGTATSTVTDAAGRTTERRQYHGATPTPGTAGSWDAMTSSYNRRGQLEWVRDAANNTWTYTYDLRGNVKTQTDPDKGTTSFTYDANNRIKSSTDSRNKKLYYFYDALDRKTVLRENSPSGNQLAQWSYDTVALGKLTTSTRKVSGSLYQNTVLGYTDDYQPTATQVIIPSAETGLNGTYTFNYTYNIDGSLASSTLPGTNGDLPDETLTYGYTNLGLPSTVDTLLAPSTNQKLVAGSTYDALGWLGQVTLDTDNTAGGRVYLTYNRELETGRTTQVRTDRDSVSPYTVADLNYSYDDAGNVTKLADVAPDPVDDTQCFSYDHLRRLTAAWTPANGNCATDPASATMGGPASYWHSWTIDAVGNRTSQTVHGIGGGSDATTNYTYPAAGSSRPHSLTSTSGAQTAAFAYDNTGNTLCRPAGTAANNCGTGSNSQTMTWNSEGDLASTTDSAGTTTYLYDADGNRLIKRDPTGKTLYLGGQEIRFTTSGGLHNTTRYYTFAGHTVAVRTATALTWLGSDQQGTAQAAIDQATGAATIRRQNPYGETRGTAGTIPGTKGFVGGTQDTNGLTHLGAREYDPRIGRFISVDPVADPDDPQQWQGYSYADNSPVTQSDPAGTDPSGTQQVWVHTATYYIMQGNTVLAVIYVYTLVTITTSNGGSGGGSSSAGGSSGNRPFIGPVATPRNQVPQPSMCNISPPAPPKPSCHGWGCVGQWFKDNRGTLVTGLALLGCLGGPIVCAVGQGIAAGVRVQQRIEEQGWRDSAWENVFDVGLTGATLGLGAYLQAGARTATATSQFGNLTHAGAGIRPYWAQAQLTQGFRGEIQAHHLIEQRFAAAMGASSTGDWLSVIVTRAEHQVFTNAWRSAIPYGAAGTGSATRAQVENAARQIYADYPEILQALGLG